MRVSLKRALVGFDCLVRTGDVRAFAGELLTEALRVPDVDEVHAFRVYPSQIRFELIEARNVSFRPNIEHDPRYAWLRPYIYAPNQILERMAQSSPIFLYPENPLPDVHPDVVNFHARQGHKMVCAFSGQIDGQENSLFVVAFREKRSLRADEQKFFLTLAAFLKRAVSLANLLEETVAAALDEERARLVREIHGSAAQAVSLTLMHLRAMQSDEAAGAPSVATRLGPAIQAAQQASSDLRSEMFRMTPEYERYGHLLDELKKLIQENGPHINAAITLTYSGKPRPISPSIGLQLYSVVKESLSNAIRHAGAKQIVVTLQFGMSSVTVRVADDGVGIAGPSPPSGMGHAIMQMRMARVGGNLEVCCPPSGGVTIVATAPA